MEFWAFEDEADVFHCVLFPKAYEKFCRLLVSVQPLVISGVVQEEYEAVTVNVVNVSALQDPRDDQRVTLFHQIKRPV